MADDTRRADQRDPRQPDLPPADAMADRPTELRGRSWWGVLKRTVGEFKRDALTDWAAALTYYSVLSIFPGLVVLVAAFSLVGDVATTEDVVNEVAPGGFAETINNLLEELREGRQTAGVLAVAGLAGALWSASGYVGAFMRASNSIYDVPEGRPIWKTLPIRLGVTVVTGVLLAVSALAVVFTGTLADQVGSALGVQRESVLVWDILKWPVLVGVISLLFALLYWASPNAKQGGFRWVSPGGVLAVIVWILASAGFAVYVANFGTYDRTYGALGGVIAFLVWLWISNIAVLLGAEFDAELERGRAIEAGHPAEKEPFVPLRDTRKVKEGQDQDLT
jgi:membrane protein